MILSEVHIIDNSKEIDEFLFKTKNLYNKANYLIRQEFISTGKYLTKFEMFGICKDLEEYNVLPARISRGVLRILDANWQSFFSCIKKWRTNKELFREKPNLPKYLKKDGRFTALFYDNAILKSKKLNSIGFSGLKLRIKPKTKNKIIEVQLIPINKEKIKISIAYDYEEEKLKPNNNRYISIDLGLNNLMTVTSNVDGFKPIIINGKPLKSINQYYNKKLARLRSILVKTNNSFNSKRIDRLLLKRNNKICDYLHKSSKYLINICIENNINSIIIGYNEFWKQNINLGKRNNQNFVQIPFQKLFNMILNKCKKFGINFITHEESYTSKCSFLDNEPITKHIEYSGKRIKRGLFRSSKGILINADVNGSYNIMKKAVPNVFANGIEGVAVHPKVISL